MKAFEIRVVDIYSEKECWMLSQWVYLHCCCFFIVSDYNIITVTGVLNESTNIKTFRNLMQINLKRWGILHDTDWVNEITIERYLDEYGYALRGHGRDHTILRIAPNLHSRHRTSKELAFELCQRQIKNYDRSILEAAFTAWKLH
jgi:hypothetical protein